MSRAYDIITDRIIGMLEGGVVPWRKTWDSCCHLPHNAGSKRPYRGINGLLLGLMPYRDPRWLTFAQAVLYGGYVKRGEKATPVVFWKQYEVEMQEDEGTVTKTIPFLRLYHVFNVQQCEGLALPAIELMGTPPDPIEAAEAIVKGMPNPPSIANDGGNEAFYRRSTDSIHMPGMVAFEKADEYYATLFHELTHSTGHKSRLDRDLSYNPAPFGSPDYSKEELVAELGAAFLSNGIGLQNDLPNSAAYISNWLKTLRNDKAMVIHAASRAQKAADYILGHPVVEV